MIRRLFWMALGAAGALWLIQRLKRLTPRGWAGGATDAARRLVADVNVALAEGRDAKRRTESDMWSHLGGNSVALSPNVIEVPEEPFAPLRNALGQPPNRR